MRFLKRKPRPHWTTSPEAARASIRRDHLKALPSELFFMALFIVPACLAWHFLSGL